MNRVRRGIVALIAATMALCGCDKMKSLTVSPEEIVCYSEDQCQILTDADYAQFTSRDDFYATVDQTGLVTAEKVGQTSIKVIGDGTIKEVPVTVKPRYNLYPNVDVLIGKSGADVQDLLGRSYVINKDAWIYSNLMSAASIIVTFENNIVDNVIVLVSTAYTAVLPEHLMERYSLKGITDDYVFQLNRNKNVLIGLTVYNLSYLAVVYVNNTSSKGTGSLDDFEFELFGLQSRIAS